ncbi:4473_t:CDS:1, partial [Funneliformis caledonium]
DEEEMPSDVISPDTSPKRASNLFGVFFSDPFMLTFHPKYILWKGFKFSFLAFFVPYT